MTTHDIIALIWRSTLTGSIAICLVLALRLPVRRWLGAQTAYLLWALVPAMLLAVCLPSPPLPIDILPAIGVSKPAAVSGIIAASRQRGPSAQGLLLALWLLGVAGYAAMLLRQQSRFVRGLGVLQRDAEGWRCESAGAGPALVGALRPRIVLPADFHSRYSARERDLIIAHERVHLRRGDAQINALVALLRCLNWFNPLVHLAASRFRFDQELACDAAVIARFPEARRSYADAMLKAQLVGGSRQELRLPAGCYWPPSHPLKERIAMLKFPVLNVRRRVLASAAIVSLTLAAGYASWAAQPAGVAASDESTTAGATQRDTEEQANPPLVINLPEPSTNPLPQPNNPPDPIVLAVRSSGQYYWNNSLVSEEQMQQMMAVQAKKNPQPELLILADKSAKYQLVASAMADAKNAGMEKIGFQSPRGSKLDLTLRKVASEALRERIGNAMPAMASANGRQLAINDEKPAAATQHVPSIQLGEIQDVAPSENITYRSMKPPVYPSIAERAGVGASLVLKVLVDAQGNAQSAEIEKLVLSGKPKPDKEGVVADRAALDDAFTKTSIAAVMSWKYNAGSKDGKPSSGYAFVPIDFSVHD
jgi:beta-lactamase regulating signal transducer with metallopeptidase domain/biopolymer transport protein ExbD